MINSHLGIVSVQALSLLEWHMCQSLTHYSQLSIWLLCSLSSQFSCTLSWQHVLFSVTTDSCWWEACTVQAAAGSLLGILTVNILKISLTPCFNNICVYISLHQCESQTLALYLCDGIPAWQCTCTEATGNESVSCQIWRSCTACTPGTLTILRPRSDRQMFGGVPCSSSSPYLRAWRGHLPVKQWQMSLLVWIQLH